MCESTLPVVPLYFMGKWPSLKLALAFAALALGLSTFTTLLVRTLCTHMHEPGLGDVKLGNWLTV